MSRNLRVSVRIAARAVLVCLESRPAPLAWQVPAGGGTAGGQRESTACMADRLHSPPPPLCRPAGPMKSSRKRSSSRFARPPDRPGVRAMCEPNRRAKHRGGQSFKQSLDALRTTPGRRSPGPFSRNRGGSTFIQMVDTRRLTQDAGLVRQRSAGVARGELIPWTSARRSGRGERARRRTRTRTGRGR